MGITLFMLAMLSFEFYVHAEITSDYAQSGILHLEKQVIGGFPDQTISMDGYTFDIKGSASEQLKIVIGCPEGIDINDELSIYVGAIRNAKAVYVQPYSITITLVSANQDDTMQTDDNTTDPFVFGVRSGYLDISDKTESTLGTWKVNSSAPVTRLAKGLPIYNASFGKIGQRTYVKAIVKMEWIAPWHEVLTQTAEKTIQIAEWSDFQKQLETRADDIKETTANATDVGTALRDSFKNLRTSLDSVGKVFQGFSKLGEIGITDPGAMHMYLINMSYIIDPTNPYSYVSTRLNPANGGYMTTQQYNEYLAVLAEINQGYQESKIFLQNKGVNIIETMVNTSYEMGWDDDAFMGFPENDKYDADYDEEHLNDCSFEFLIEGNVWGGSPYLQHEPYEIDITSDFADGSVDLVNTPSNVLTLTGKVASSKDSSEHIYFYDDMFEVVVVNKADRTDVDVIGMDKITLGTPIESFISGDIEPVSYTAYQTFTHTAEVPNPSLYDVILRITPPGEYRKANKAIVVNLMYDLFPMLSRIYAIPRGLLDEPVTLDTQAKVDSYNFINTSPLYNITCNSTYYYNLGGAYGNDITSPNQFSLGDTIVRTPADRNHRYYMPVGPNDFNETVTTTSPMPIMLLDFGGVVTDASVEAPIPWSSASSQYKYMNITDYFSYLAPFNDGLPFYVNPLAKPFQTLVYDEVPWDNDGDGQPRGLYSAEYTEADFTARIDADMQAILGEGVADIFGAGATIDFFSFADTSLLITADEVGGSISPSRTIPQTWFYKNNYGNWIDAFFNGTRVGGNDPNHFDMMTVNPKAWTFKKIDFSILEGLEFVPTATEFNIVPFQGPYDQVPIGMMAYGSTTLIQLASDDMKAGFGYAWGLVFLSYRRAVDTTKAIYDQIILNMATMPGGSAETVQQITADRNALEQAWIDLDTDKINELILKATYYATDNTAPTAVANPMYGSTPEDEGVYYSLEYAEYQEGDAPQSASLPRSASAPQASGVIGQWIGDAAEWYGNELFSDIKFPELPKIDFNAQYISQYSAVLYYAWKNVTAVEATIIDAQSEASTVDVMSGAGSMDILNQVRAFIRDRIKPLITASLNTIIQFINRTAAPFSVYFKTTIPQFINYTYQNASHFIKACLAPVRHFLSHQVEKIQGAWNTGVRYLQTGVNAVSEWINGIKNKILSGGTDVWNSIVDGIDRIRSKMYAVADDLGCLGGAVRKLADKIALQKFAYTPTSATVFNFADKVIEKTDTAFDNLQSDLEKDWTGVHTHVDAAMFAISNALGGISNVMGSQIDKISKVMIRMIKNGMDMAYAFIDQMDLLITAINATMAAFKAFLNAFVDACKLAFQMLGEMLSKLGEILSDAIGKSFEWLVDTTAAIFPQLNLLEKELLRNPGFLTVADFFYPPLKKARLASGYIDYALGFGQMSAETFYQWVNVYQPMALIEGADQGFYIYQIGTEFTDQLYFITEKRGQLVDCPVFNVTVQQYTNYSDFGMPGLTPSDPVEGPVEGVVSPFKYSVDGNIVPGVRYVNFSEGYPIRWFKNNTDPESEQLYRPAEPGLYMTHSTASILNSTNPIVYVNSSWAELTYLFSDAYVEDAFLELDLTIDGVNDNETKVIAAGGAPVTMKLNVINEMWSRPNVTIQLLFVTEDGYPIAQKDEDGYQVEMPGTVASLDLSFRVGKYAPAGTHDLIITVIETNGDRTIIRSQMTVEQSNPFATFLFQMMNSWIPWVSIGIAMAILIGGFVYGSTRKIKKKTLDPFELLQIKTKSQAPGGCSYDDIQNGTCNLPGFTRSDWVCDPMTKVCVLKSKTNNSFN